MDPSRIYLTKSRFINSFGCAKAHWMAVHKPLPFTDPEAGSIQAIGTEIGEHACKLFPDGVLVAEAAYEHQKALETTQKLMADDGVPAIYEACLEFNNIRIRVDILERLSDERWGLKEVKSSTSVKEYHLHDVAVQLYVLEGCGLNISSAELIHVNSNYVRSDGEIIWEEYFQREELLGYLPDEQGTIEQVAYALEILSQENAPDPEYSSECKKCDFFEPCCGDKPDDWVLYLPRLHKNKLARFMDMGIERTRDIPDDFKLTANQEIVRQVWLTDQPYISPDLSKSLKQFERPAFYLDFETFAPALPIYEGTRPFQTMPFQWSLHHVDENDELQHWEFLASGAENPALEFCESLVRVLTQTDGPIIVYSGYEAQTLKRMQMAFPDLAGELAEIIDRLEDLLLVVRGHTYFKEYKGSYSIKKVGPTLAPNVRYDELEHVNEGQGASYAFECIAGGLIKNKTAQDTLREALLAYCKLDTLAMVEVHSGLSKLA